MQLSSVWTFVGGLVSGGLLIKGIDLGILWLRERRELRKDKVSQQKDRPRFRVDVTIPAPNYPTRPTVVVDVLSLGNVPLTIDALEAFIESPECADKLAPQQLAKREISSITPIRLEMPVKQNLIHPTKVPRVPVKLICQFSYEGNGKYCSEYHYNREKHQFTEVTARQG